MRDSAQNTNVARAEAPRLVALVVSYNRLEKLRKTLSALMAVPSKNLFRIVVVDNASTDGSRDYLADLSAQQSRVVVIEQPTNTGGAGGFARGLHDIKARYDPDWVVTMDDDAYPTEDCLQEFLAQDRGGDVYASAVHLPNGDICEMNRPSRDPFRNLDVFLSTLRHGRSGFHVTPDDFSRPPQPVDAASFVGLFLSRRALDMSDGPEADLFLYGDDTLYTLGLSRAGARIIFDPGLRFIHDFSSFETVGFRMIELWRVYYYYRNLLVLYRYAAGWLFWPFLPLLTVKWLMRVRHYRGARLAYLKQLGRAMTAGIFRPLRISGRR